MGDILSSISSPEDIKRLNFNSLYELSGEIREFLIDSVLKTGGHLASNLGTVELTCALHKVFDAPTDKIIWDVGHQSYTHKILTGRRDAFDTLRTFGGISGFPKPSESIYDCFETGHSGTSLSVAFGFACARDLRGEKNEVIAVIGDAAFSGGMPMEAINCISQSKKKIIIVLNDNQMSIGKNMGALAKYLNEVRTKPSYYNVKREAVNVLDSIPLLGKQLENVIRKTKGYIKYMITPGVVFEQLGYKYLGPVDGHNIEKLCNTFDEARKIQGPVIVHVCTTKGKGYKEAELSPDKYHGVSPSKCKELTFTKQFGETICDAARENDKVLCICPSMISSCGLDDFAKNFPDRIFDTGIAEAHAVTFAAGLAQNGFTPVAAIYSSFLQRAYDSIMHDVALGNRHVVFAVDRAGIVGADGETHQGIYDLSYLTHIPNMTVLAPSDSKTLDAMIRYAVNDHDGPIAVRYPKRAAGEIDAPNFEFGHAAILRSGDSVTIASLGSMTSHAISAADELKKSNISAEIIDIRSAKPIDFDLIFESADKTGLLITVEDNIKSGGVGEKILAYAAENGCEFRIKTLSFPDEFIPAGTQTQLFVKYGLSASKIAEKIKDMLKNEAET